MYVVKSGTGFVLNAETEEMVGFVGSTDIECAMRAQRMSLEEAESVVERMTAKGFEAEIVNLGTENLATVKPTPEDRRDGLKKKYNITHADGSPVDADAKYFWLRLDYHEGCDRKHIAACRQAALYYAQEIRHHLPALSADLREICTSNPPSRQSDEDIAALLDKVEVVRTAIAQLHAGEPARNITGRMDCPACGAMSGLSYRISGTNGHIGAICAGHGCGINFQE